MSRPMIVAMSLLLGSSAVVHAQVLTLEPDDSICLIGNTLPERMQHDGWLETLIHGRFPEHNLTVRNLAFSGDTLTVRLRSAGFGDPDDFLTKLKADVVFAFFGYGESFAGEAGLAQFKTDLKAFIEHSLGQKYNGESAPQIVLFAPIAHENIGDRNLPDGREHNRLLELYTRTMRQVAEQQGVPFVDLFAISRSAYSAGTPLTINGVHLSSEGNQTLAPAIDESLFGPRTAPIDWSRLEPLRQAILDKNLYWFHRYRATDGYSTYGGRSYLKFVNDQTNREVMQRELEVLEQMTANRDRRVWAAAKHQEFEVDDSNLPPLINVISNKPGDGPGGAHLVVTGEDGIGLMTVHQNMTVNLFADEAQFPELVNPVQMAVDPKGRTWIAVWPTYPHWQPGEEMNDKLLILEDTDGDGTADRCKTFADKLHNPTGFEFWNGGVLIAMTPDLWFLKDTDGDDVADVRTRILHGLDSADTHHTSNSFTFDPGGNLYFQEGVFHRTQTETPYGIQRNYDACVWRYNPRLQSFGRYISYGFANPHGHVFDRWGQGIVHDGTGANPYHDTLISGYIPFPQKHAIAPNVYERRTRPCSGTEILSSSHFPPELQGNLLVANVIGFQGILNYRLKPDGSSFGADEVEPIVFSSDPNFRPSDLEIGGDGALYFTDWYNPLIGHMQHNLRDPSRDKRHGRVYRVTCNGRELLKPEPLDQLSIPQLLERLKSPDNRIRYRTRIALSAHPSEDVIAAVRVWMPRLDKSDPDYEHHLLEALWVHQHHNVIDESLLKQLLNAIDSRARAAAIKVLVDWRDSIPLAIDLLKVAAEDGESRVRLEAERGASFFADPAALEVAIISSELPTDRFLDYTRNETLKVLEPQWKEAIASGYKVEFTTAAGKRYYLRNIGTKNLLALPRDEAVFMEILERDGIAEADRLAALQGLAQIQNTTPLQVLLNTIQNIDQTARNESVVFDLVRLLTSWNPGELKQFRTRLIEMATSSGYPIVRQISYVALMAADNSVEDAWKLATSSIANLRDFLGAIPLVLDPSFQSALYPRVKLLLNELPEDFSSLKSGAGAFGRYVRIELPGNQRTLTLAEVEVFSNGRNIARQRIASQSSTAFGGEAKRAIDGNTSGIYGAQGQTHTQVDSRDPWWELDLGEEQPIERIIVWNRTEGTLGDRLDGFSLQILDSSRNVIHEEIDVPAPDP
ncbi:MAG TPA: PVC-type heme-binding CxxCH protein, partial [Planctomycetaceae bacterium]|nr:PVC-type heme-binding CxxCH protein [Planctomycetaceae bacterium]